MEIIHVSNLGRNLHLLRSSIGWSQTGGRRCGFLTQMRPLLTRSAPQRFNGNFFGLRCLSFFPFNIEGVLRKRNPSTRRGVLLV